MSTAMALVILGGVTTTYVFLLALLRSTQNDKEPPVVLDSIPFVSPILGMVRWSMDFYSVMKKRFHDLPMYTLRMPGARIYVVNALDLIPVVHKQWRTLIFAPIQVKAAKAVMGVSQGAVAILERDMVTEAGFVNGMIKATHPTMINGPALEALNIRAFEVLDVALKGLNAPTTISMYSWIDEQIMHATTEAIYGPSNPMRNASNLEHWQ
ncbi:hypothetical protein PFICI_06369 [Pestalotiopsis fici W106-1]|uniref:Cytochrome P450 n=1 Tax=Pestalotiopsis fici (strain W106-1 / CGMCC3.15140) TaxID=1229662 RepID=W3X7K6_PESFW|nr:uncharacterized protein PFICI_06369 [Pestalotiopsis fici W106-1]ETS81367.1 hypothetical protein PFICI_06369 [Pestalotiopsis fici W106-1]